jgi:KDO2-lipid IV(A) lauroyltransferase
MRFVFSMLRALPRCVLVWILSFAALLVYVLFPKRKKLAQENIKMAIGGNYKKTALKTYLYFAKMTAENIKYLGNEDYIKTHAKITGLENYKYAKSLNRGIIFSTAHFGNFEMMVCAFALLVEPVTIIVRPLDNKALNSIIEEKRTSCGNKLMSSKHANAFNFMKVLKRNGLLGILTDQGRRGDKMVVKFFNRDARVAEGVAVFAHKLGVPVLPAYIKEHAGGYEVVIEEPIFADKSKDFQSDAKEIMGKLHKRFERWIRKEPYKYLWMHDRWK